MPTPFAVLEQRLNSAVTRHLANAEATFAGGQPFPVLFAREGVQPLGDSVDAVYAAASYSHSSAPAVARGSVLVIGGASYTVDTDAQPDASGWVRVGLVPSAGG